jgi:dUTPase
VTVALALGVVVYVYAHAATLRGEGGFGSSGV